MLAINTGILFYIGTPNNFYFLDTKSLKFDIFILQANYIIM